MHSYNVNESTMPTPPRFESALALWITRWQRQLVYGIPALSSADTEDWS